MAGGVFALLITAAPVSSQEDVQASFGETVDVRVINLDVVVTDRSGDRVTGLGAEDFRLLVDGEEVPISYFTEIREGRVTGASEPAAGAEPRPTGLAAGEAVPTHYLVFLDDDFALDHQRDQVIDHMIGQISRLQPEDRVALVRYDGDRVQVLADWIAPGPELSEALERARELDGWGIRRLLEARGFAFNDPTFNTPVTFVGGEPGGATIFQQNLRWQTRDRLGIEMLAAASAITRFNGTPGRKVLILLAGDWPATGALSPYGGSLDGPAFSHGFDVFRPLVETANLLSWTVYPVGVSPRFTPVSSGALDAGAVGGDRDRLLANAGAQHQTLRVNAATSRGIARRSAVDSTLRYLAAQTGGRAVLYGSRTAALQEVAEDTRSYYWIGFQPTFAGDDERHRVKIEIRRSGLSARSREGYIDLAPATARLLALQNELITGDATAALR